MEPDKKVMDSLMAPIMENADQSIQKMMAEHRRRFAENLYRAGYAQGIHDARKKLVQEIQDGA
jgi:flagellar biosynthesis/type III secretory pathway protein FliH